MELRGLGFLCFFVAMTPYFDLAKSAKVLSVPQNMISHITQHCHVAYAMAAGGHEVTLMVPSNTKLPDFIQNVTGVQIVHYLTNRPVPLANTPECSELFIRAALAKSSYEKNQIMMEMFDMLQKSWHEDCEAMLESQTVQDHMKNNKYDLALADNAAMDTFMVLPVAYDIPYIIYGIMFYEWVYKVPALPSFSPHLYSTFGDEMTFWERVQNTLLYSVSDYLLENNVTLYDKYAPSKNIKHIYDVYRNSLLYFVLDDPALSYPRPTMPNVHYVGDTIPRPAKKLPDNLLDFVENAEHGVIYVSFGSIFDFIPEDIVSKFCHALLRLPQRIVWKLKIPKLCPAKENKLLLMNWVPQNDLLGHPNVKLFISHCGINSVLESVYHGVPILGVPLTFDQPYNAHRIKNRGQGLVMDIGEFTEEELVSKASTILKSDAIKKNMQKFSDYMRNKSTGPVEHVSYWVNHVLKYGDHHLRSGAFKLTTTQFYALDVLLVLTLAMGALIILLCSIFCFCIQCFKKCFKRQSNTKTKSE